MYNCDNVIQKGCLKSETKTVILKSPMLQAKKPIEGNNCET